MMKIFLLFALVASASALQNGPPEAAPEPYSYAYQTDSHGAAEQRDPAGRVQGYYTLADADGRERRVEYVADENGFRAKVQTNEMGTKAESPADVELQAAEPSPAQYAAAAQYSAGASAAQGAQLVRQTYTTTAAAAPVSANYAANNYQQYSYRPYGATSYYASGAYPFAYNGYGSNYNSAYGGYGLGYGSASYYAGGFPSGAFYSAAYPATSGYYGYTSGAYAPAGQYYSYRSSTGSAAPAPAPATAAYTTNGAVSGYRVYAQPAGAVTTTYRQVSGVAPVSGVATYSAGFPAATFGVNGAATGTGSSASRSFQGSSNYIVLKKRDAENKQEKAAASS